MSLVIPSVNAGKRRYYSEKFERYKVGSLPSGWTIRPEVMLDQASVQQDFAVQGKKSLKLFEVTDGISSWVKSDDFRSYITEDFEFSFKFRIVGITQDRASFGLMNENDVSSIAMNCRLNDNWRYYTSGSWHDIPNLPVPQSELVYTVKIIVDSKNELMNINIDGHESGWLGTKQSWEYIKRIKFSTNDNYPSEFWIDDIKINELHQKKK